MIDLHSHTNESDGTFTPHELVGLAMERGVEALDEPTSRGRLSALRTLVIRGSRTLPARRREVNSPTGSSRPRNHRIHRELPQPIGYG